MKKKKKPHFQRLNNLSVGNIYYNGGSLGSLVLPPKYLICERTESQYFIIYKIFAFPLWKMKKVMTLGPECYEKLRK